MKLNLSDVLITALFVTGLTACGEKEAPPAPAPVVVPAAAEPVKVEPAPSAGGYEPSAEERIPGITIPPNAIAAPDATAPVVGTEKSDAEKPAHQ